MSTYSQEQQIHSLSLITNAAFGLEFPNYAALQAYTTQVVTSTLTDDQEAQNGNNNIGLNYLGSAAAGTAWQLVWGPVVFCHDMTASPIPADNTMALYYNASQNLFVVGIAGTNSVSMYGWGTEDFEVGITVPWTEVNANSHAPSAAAIAEGSSTGLNNLFTLTDSNYQGRTMIQQLQYFLVNSVKQNATYPNPKVAVAGHSLGGALTPIMALYLYETMSTWNTGTYKVSTIMAYPTAGPTCGNLAFANYVESLPSASFVYVSKYNTLDVVPQAWQLSSMVNVPFLYDKATNSNSDIVATTPPDCVIASLALGAIASSVNPTTKRFNIYTQITPHTPMTGSYVSVSTIAAAGSQEEQELYTGASKIGDIVALLDATLVGLPKIGQYSTFLQNFIYFLLEAAYQHTTAYNATNMLNIQGLATEFMYVKQNTPGGPTGADQPMHSLLIQKMIATHPMLKGIGTLAGVNVEAGALAEA